MNERPEIYVSTFPHNMQTWYEEKLTIVMNSLNIIKENIDLLSSDVTTRDLIIFPLDTAMIYTQDVLDMSTGNN